jgi:hypothetical protein
MKMTKAPRKNLITGHAEPLFWDEPRCGHAVAAFVAGVGDGPRSSLGAEVWTQGRGIS